MEWINAKEELPENGEIVLIVSNGDYHIAEFFAEDKSFAETEEYKPIKAEDVTHGMRIIAPDDNDPMEKITPRIVKSSF